MCAMQGTSLPFLDFAHIPAEGICVSYEHAGKGSDKHKSIISFHLHNNLT